MAEAPPTTPTRSQLWYGRDEPPRSPRLLRAGPVTALLDGRDLRTVRFGGVTLVDRIYVAVRDRNWGTTPGEPESIEVEEGDDRFVVRFDCTHRQHDVDVTWRGEITGAPDGVISYTMDARWNADAVYKLIGFNTHHGVAECAGRQVRGVGPGGSFSAALPRLVAAQFVEDETEVPILPPVDSLEIELGEGVGVRFDFEGDPFEVEDQRNWTDASFKAQSFTPRRQGFYRAKAGDHVRQKVTVSPLGALPPAPAAAEAVRLTLGEPTGRLLPPFGLGQPSHGQPLSAREAELLRALQLDHLRVDLILSAAAQVALLDRAIHDASLLGCGLELALFVDPDQADRELSFVATRLMSLHPPVRRVLVYSPRQPATPTWLSRLAAARLRDILPGALIAGGTNAHFCELNRERPERAPDEGVVYAITPQAHAFDERSIAENAAAQAATVDAARALYGDRPIVVGPVTLKPRYNAVAASAAPEVTPDELPASVDPRQMSLFAAGWTLGSVKALSEAGAASISYYETTGWRGVIETETGSPLPHRFPSRPGMVYPVYHLFADLAEWPGAELVSCTSADHVAVDGLALRSGAGLCLLIANLTPESRAVAIGPMPSSELATRRLNADNALPALTDPATFRSGWVSIAIEDGELRLDLEPFELVRVDAETANE